MFEKIAVTSFFTVYFLIGCFIFKDYGISWDEPGQRHIGYVNFEYVVRGDKTLLQSYYPEKEYGPFFELILVTIERAFKIQDTRAIYLVRHLITFFSFYISIIFFYLLGKKIFKDWKPALIDCILLILSPRIFSDSFYNTKDIPLLSFFVISAYTLLLLTEKEMLLRIFVHSLASAATISIRVLGILMPMLTIIVLVFSAIKNKKEVKLFRTAVLYLLFTSFFTVAFWPLLWSNPLNIISVFQSLANYQYQTNLPVLYLGQYISPFSLPWHYIPVWIFITTPISLLILFVVGLIKEPVRFQEKNIKNFIIFFLFFVPIIGVIVLHSTLYDGWRHLYFIYPFFIIIAVKGLLKAPKILKALVFFEMATVIVFIVKNHPHEMVYFNLLLSRNMSETKKNFELDYWGSSYRKALEYIVSHDKSANIPITVANNPGDSNSLILKVGDRKRLQYWSMDDIDKAKYFVSNYRWHPDEYSYENEVFNVKVNEEKIMVVYKLR